MMRRLEGFEVGRRKVERKKLRSWDDEKVKLKWEVGMRKVELKSMAQRA
jgi:hypothetical protein